MNLIEIIRRKEATLQSASPGLTLCDYEVDGVRMRSVFFPVGSHAILSDIFTFNELRVLSVDMGLRACRVAPSKKRETFDGRLELAIELIEESGETHELARVYLTDALARWRAVELNWPWGVNTAQKANLSFRCIGREVDNSEAKSTDGIILGVRSAIDVRETAYLHAKGRGVELGPGPYPKVTPKEGTEVTYYETATVEELSGRYTNDLKTPPPSESVELWKNYNRDDGQQLEAIENASLDFILSSHVFEHFVNPLGTLEIWKRKLKPGGIAIGVVPHANNIFDTRQPLSTADEWLTEWREKTWALQEKHYRKWCAFTHPNTEPSYWRLKNFSIHAHYFSPRSFSDLLEIAKSQLGFKSYQIQSGPNFKEFVFLLRT